MKRSDMKDAYAPVPRGFHDALIAAVREVREEEPMKKRHFSLLAALVIVALLCGTAVAVVNYYSVRDYQADGMPSEAFEKHIVDINAEHENEYIRAVFGDAIFDGEKMAITMNLFSKNEQKRVFLYPVVEGYCGDRKLDLMVEGMRGLDESGFLFPSLEWDERYLENAYGLDVNMESGADTDVQWVFKLYVLAPNWEIVDNPILLTGDETDPPLDEYMQRYRDAYADRKIMTSYGSSLAEYASIVPVDGGEMPLYERLLQCGAFTLSDVIEQTFVTPLPAIKVVEHKTFAFDDYTVEIDRLSASFMRAQVSLRRVYAAAQEDSTDNPLLVSYELRDQNGAVLYPVSTSYGLRTDDRRTLGFDASYTTDGQTITAITFVPYRFETTDEHGVNVRPIYDESHAFTVSLDR